jgi:hypothetical protein
VTLADEPARDDAPPDSFDLVEAALFIGATVALRRPLP